MVALSQFGLLALLLHIGSCAEAEDDLNIINKNFTNMHTDVRVHASMQAQLAALEQTMTQLVRHDSLTEARLALIERKIQKEQSDSTKESNLEKDIVTAINQGSFAIAEEKILELHDPTIVAYIVRDMFANSDHDFGVLVNLTKSLNNTFIKSQILKNLYYRVSESDNISPMNLIALAKCLSEQGRGYHYDRVIGINSFKKLLDQIAENTTATFVDVMKWQLDYQTSSEVRALAAGIAEWRDVSKKVMIGLVSGVFGTVDSNIILDAVCNHSDAWQALVGVDALIERLKHTDSLKGSITMDIAFHLNDILKQKNLNSFVQANAMRVKKKIPECIRNFSSVTGFCIYNRYWDSILMPSSYNPDPRVNVVIRPRKNRGAEATWRHYKNHEKLVLQNMHYDSILHASNITNRDSHNVYTTDGLELNDENSWILEPAGDSCFLKSYWNSEYMFGSIVEFRGDNLVLTKPLESSSAYENPRFKWQFVDC